MNVKITLEFDNRPDKADVYNYLTDLIANDCLQYDIEGAGGPKDTDPTTIGTCESCGADAQYDSELILCDDCQQ